MSRGLSVDLSQHPILGFLVSELLSKPTQSAVMGNTILNTHTTKTHRSQRRIHHRFGLKITQMLPNTDSCIVNNSKGLDALVPCCFFPDLHPLFHSFSMGCQGVGGCTCRKKSTLGNATLPITTTKPHWESIFIWIPHH